MAKRKDDNAPSFEAALAELEAIARELEQGSLGLDESLQRFEQGVSLLRRCYGLLDSAERKISLLAGFDGNGNPVLEPFDASATAEQGAAGRRKTRREAEDEPEPCTDSEGRPPAERGLF
jgi:exodeoxyribonuclease VII small subunit